MPDPKKFSSRSKFMASCISTVMGEGKKRDQAVAICISMWKDRNKKKDELEEDHFKIFSEDRSEIIKHKAYPKG